MSRNSTYKSFLRKYSLKKILKLYMNGEVTLNKKEWKDLHKKLERKRLFKEKASILNFVLCFLIIALISYKLTLNNLDKIEKCSKIQEHICNKEELEMVIDK